MKKLMFALLFCAAASSCSKDKEAFNNGQPATATTTAAAISNYARIDNPSDIGLIHNDALAYCFAQFSQIGAPYSLSYQQRVTLARQYCIDYLVNVNDIEMTANEIATAMDNAGYSVSQIMADSPVSGAALEQRVLNHSSLTGLKQNLCARVFRALDSANNLTEFVTLTDAILVDAQPLDDPRENEVKAVVSVGRNSWRYWVDEGNMAAWGTLFQDPNTGGRPHPEIARAAIAGDISGAIIGGCTGGLAGALVSAPLGSAGGAIRAWLFGW